MGAVVTFFLSPAIWYGFTVASTTWHDFLLSIPGVVFGYMTSGGLFYWVMDRILTEPRTRARIFGVAHNIGAVLFGGTAPFLASLFVDEWGPDFGPIAVGCWSSAMAFISLSAYLWNRHRLRSEFERFHSEIMKSNSPRVSAVNVHEFNGLDLDINGHINLSGPSSRGMSIHGNGSNEDTITESTEFIVQPLPPPMPPAVTMRSKHLQIPVGTVSHVEQISEVQVSYFDQLTEEIASTQSPIHRQSVHSPDYALKV